MKNKMMVIYGTLAVLLIITGVVVYKIMSPKPATKTTASTPADMTSLQDSLPPVDSSIKVDLVKSTTKANTVSITADGLAGKIVSIGYELSYDSQGLIKGVNSGSTPIDTTGKDTFSREIYLGTCSRNDCTPDLGVTKVSVVLEFTDTAGKKSQFSKDYDL
ncbi:MAG TPA: hypothetical protein VMR81_06810 [Patescibacteria group bacterium]|nr:hypothetical protein [Patescibacteria group bacterium]